MLITAAEEAGREAILRFQYLPSQAGGIRHKGTIKDISVDISYNTVSL